jgi:hypothetical protein
MSSEDVIANLLFVDRVDACSSQIAIRLDRDTYEGLFEVSGDHSVAEFVDNSTIEPDKVLEPVAQLGCYG